MKLFLLILGFIFGAIALAFGTVLLALPDVLRVVVGFVYGCLYGNWAYDVWSRKAPHGRG